MIFKKLLKRKPVIKISIKLLAGFDKLDGYDPEKGFVLELTDGTKLKNALKLVDIPQKKSISYIINGEKANMNSKLGHGDEVFCFFPMAGG